MRILVDHSHLGRTVTGLERITLELFSGAALAPLVLEPVTGGSLPRMVAEQQIGLPLRLAADRRAIVICPGFPPSIPLVAFGRRVVPYIHDCFLLTRQSELNWRARHYMAPAFRRAVARLPWFLVNSLATAAELARFCRPDAEITPFRPLVRDVFGVGGMAGGRALSPGGTLDLLALGTVEPRKNLAAAAAIVGALSAAGQPASLHIVGRVGWGGEAEKLAAMPGVVLHGYQPAEAVRARLSSAHALISTSHDEGLGLPLIEAQYAGLPVIAPDKPVFREVLGTSGLLIDPGDPAAAAARIAAALTAPGAFAAAAAGAAANIRRWNDLAAADRRTVIARLTRLAGGAPAG